MSYQDPAMHDMPAQVRPTLQWPSLNDPSQAHKHEAQEEQEKVELASSLHHRTTVLISAGMDLQALPNYDLISVL